MRRERDDRAPGRPLSRRAALATGGLSIGLLGAPGAAGAEPAPTFVVDAAGGGDYRELEPAVAAAPAGSRVTVRGGVYTIARRMQPRAGVSIVGEGHGTLVRARDGLDANILQITADFVTIEALRIDANAAGQSIPCNAVAFFGCRGGRVAHCVVQDASGYAVVGFAATELLVEANHVFGGPAAGGPIYPKVGIELHGGTHCRIVGNLVTGARTHGIYLWNATGDCAFNTVAGNVAHANGGAGILLQDGAHDNTVSANTCTHNGWGILLDADGQSGAPHDNTITANACADNLRDGMRLAGARDGVVSANVCRANGHNGIHLHRCHETTVSANVARANGHSGILLENTVGVVCDANVCNANGSATQAGWRRSGIVLYGDGGAQSRSSANVVTSNRCTAAGGPQRYGVYLVNRAEDNLVAGNSLEGNLDAGAWRAGGPPSRHAVPSRRLLVTVGPQDTPVAHELPFVPGFVIVTMTSPGSIWRSRGSDAGHVYLRADGPSRTAEILVG